MKRKVRRYVKKYITALVPAALSLLFAALYATVYVSANPSGDFEYRHELIDTITHNWFYIGLVISGALIIVMFMGDLGHAYGKHRTRRH